MNIIEKEPIWILEAMNLCYLKVNSQKPSFSLENQYRSPYYRTAGRVTKAALSQIKLSKALKYYFQAYENNSFLAGALLYTYFDFTELTAKNLKQEWITRLENALDQKYSQEIISFYGFELSHDKKGDLWKWFDEHEINTELRYRFIKALHQPRETIEDLYQILEETENILQREAASIKETLDSFYTELEAHKSSFKKYLTKQKIDWGNDLFIVPCLTNYQLVQYVGREYFSRFFTVFFGAGVSFDYAINYTTPASTNQNDFLKALADPSKLEILKILKTKDMYGQEIAERMKLKTPTISYHMETLVNLGLVTVNKESNRIYYGLNTDVLIAFLDAVKKSFL